ncbi:MAG TPA: HDIG domain-containing protein [Candidatus Paceibacterota bacterium]|nr:HDIG domain-containing protein [Candidatus Paceibacterota bacterium]
MTREEAFSWLKEEVKEPNLLKHCLAAEAAMKKLALRFGEDENVWGLTGLLHDVDYETTKDDASEHSLKGYQMLIDKGIEENIAEAVKTHNDAHGLQPATLMAKAIYCVDSLTGLIVATTLVLPSRKIKDVQVDNVTRRFKEKGFARGVNRTNIMKCEELLGLSLNEFVEITLKAMQEIDSDLGLA